MKRSIVMWCVCGMAFGLAGCANDGTAVVSATGTVIGVELGAATGTGAPTGTLGYRRAEYAFVPTNKRKDQVGNGADVKEVPNVMMELSYGGTLDAKGRIYQRLAVGTAAVQQVSGSGLFLRDAEGKIDDQTALAVKNMAQLTLTSSHQLTTCVTRDGRVDAPALKGIADRAAGAGQTAAAVKPYQAALANVTTPAQLQGLLAQSDALAAALTSHMSQADCSHA